MKLLAWNYYLPYLCTRHPNVVKTEERISAARRSRSENQDINTMPLNCKLYMIMNKTNKN